jgi:hypothetical protein
MCDLDDARNASWRTGFCAVRRCFGASMRPHPDSGLSHASHSGQVRGFTADGKMASLRE